MGKAKPPDCKWGDSCDCISIKVNYCETCTYYYWLDSGYGYCKALPEPLLVAWCRDICSLYKRR